MLDEEDAAAYRIPHVLHDSDASIAEFFGAHIACHIVRIIRPAELGDRAGAIGHLRGEDEGFARMISAEPFFCHARFIERRILAVHVAAAHTALGAVIETLARHRIHHDRSAHAVGQRLQLTEGTLYRGLADADAEKLLLRSLAPLALRSGIHLVHRDQGAGHDVLLFDLLHLHLNEIGSPALMRPRPAQHGDHLLLESILGYDPFGSGNMTSPHAM